MAVTTHRDLPARRYGPHYASVGLLLILTSIPVDLLLPRIADHAPWGPAATDLRQLSGMSLYALLAGIVLCLRGFLSRRDPSHLAVSCLGLIVATVWIGLIVALRLAI
jgi:hypothetical protein